MANNLTRDEARDRAELITVQSYQVSLDLTGGEITFRSGTTVTFSCGPARRGHLRRPGRAGGQRDHPERRPVGPGRVRPATGSADRPAAGSNELRVVADCAYSRTGEGLHRFTDPADKGVYLYSDLETFDAHRIYACFDQPDLKASFELHGDLPGRLAGGLQHGAG